VRKGDRTYTETHKAELATHISASESDFGADRVYSVSLPQGAAGSPFAQTLLRVLAPLGVIPSSVKPQGGSDVEPLGEAGVPLLDLNQDGSKYFDLHHTADDTLDKIEPAALSQNVAAWTTMAWLIADSDVDFRALATH
jgi:Zn-dependent M28 family amino/carboxypeptidase